eukprot:876599-Amorphochlora_amoeboformis.AAC.2
MFADFSDCMLEFDGYTCKIKFQTPILTPGLKDCVTWLTSDTLSLAGPNPSCRVLADRMTFQLQVRLDVNPTTLSSCETATVNGTYVVCFTVPKELT